MTFGAAWKELLAGKKIRRHSWGDRHDWIRLYNPYCDEEFKLTEMPSADGTWMSFVIMRRENQLRPWMPDQRTFIDDLRSEDWELFVPDLVVPQVPS